MARLECEWWWLWSNCVLASRVPSLSASLPSVSPRSVVTVELKAGQHQTLSDSLLPSSPPAIANNVIISISNKISNICYVINLNQSILPEMKIFNRYNYLMSCYPATLLSEVSDRNVRYIFLDWIYNESSEIPPFRKNWIDSV